MTFSKFIQMIYPLIGNGQKEDEFVLCITNQIMENPVTIKDKQNEANNTYNPLSSMQADTLKRIYNGSRNLSKKNASAILAHLEKDKFVNFLCGFSNDVIDMIGKALQDNGKEIIGDDIITSCTGVFVSILIDCADKATINKDNQEATLTGTSVSLRYVLPESSHCFIGRKDELEAIKEVLTNNSYVILTGMGGIGK